MGAFGLPKVGICAGRPATFAKICSYSNQQLLHSLLSACIGERSEVFTKDEQAIALQRGNLIGEFLRSQML